MYVSPVKCVFEPSKENKSKTIKARRKTRTVLESASNSAPNFVSWFAIFVLFFSMIEDFQIKLQLLIFSPKRTWKKQQNKRKNRKSGYEVLLGIWCRFQNCPCFSFSIDGLWLIFFQNFCQKIPLKKMKIIIFSKTKSKIKKFSWTKCA